MRYARQRFPHILTALALFASAALSSHAQQIFVIAHDESTNAALISTFTGGEGQVSLESSDVYTDDNDRKSAILVTGAGGDGQRYRDRIPGWAFSIVEKPNKDSTTEFRYITFAWKKVGGTGIQLQLHGDPNTWGHRYHAGANEKNWNPSIQVSAKIPDKWTLVTRDLWADWKSFALTGVAFTAWSLQHGIWDHMVLHQTPGDPKLPLAVEPAGKAATVWGLLRAER
ncbi:hypothetical protein FJZ36_05200 [Candidatus Poribacteria bacterium]|nr:hypothetical protein [Candidatus Poribacteria bacterium]